MKNRMIEIIKQSAKPCERGECKTCEYDNLGENCWQSKLADDIIANIATNNNVGGKGIVDLAAIKKAIKPKADSTLNNMKKADLIDYIRCLENNYNTAVWFNENQAKYVESLKLSQWIPVSERLPENDYGKHWKDRKQYLVVMSNGMYTVCRFGYKEYDWWIERNDSVIGRFNQVVKWMELEPPKENE